METLTFIQLVNKYHYRYENNVLLFERGPFSNWFGAFVGQFAKFSYEIQTSNIDWEDIEFNCCEKAMMAAKASLFQDWESLNLILKESRPKEQQYLGRQVKNFDQRVWDKNKYKIVKEINVEKFRQNPHLQEYLKLVPKHSLFAESTPDLVYGTGIDIDSADATNIRRWVGQNLLGEVLREIRQGI